MLVESDGMMTRRILCYGDSNTYGYDPRSYLGGRYPDTVRWTALLEKKGWAVFNEGENGRCIPQRAREIGWLARQLVQMEIDAAVIVLGTNDLLQEPELSAEGCARRMEGFITEILRRTGPEWPGQILLAAPPPMREGPWVISEEILEASAHLPNSYKAAAERTGIAFAAIEIPEDGLSFDGVHLSESGHRAVAEVIGRKLTELFR